MSNLMAQYDAYLNDIRDRINRVIQDELRLTWIDYLGLFENKVHDIFDSVIQDFYSDYSPISDGYSRNESLYNVLKTEVSGTKISIEFVPENMTPFRSGYTGEDGLYDQVFRRGWHGGAGSGEGHPSEGRPYWREPIPYYSHWGKEAPVFNPSPLERVQTEVSNYWKNEMPTDFKALWREHFNNIKFN